MRPPELTTGSTTSSWPWKSLSPRIWTSMVLGAGFFAATDGHGHRQEHRDRYADGGGATQPTEMQHGRVSSWGIETGRG